MCNNWKAQLLTFTNVTYEKYDQAHIQLYVHMIPDSSSSSHSLNTYLPFIQLIIHTLALNHIIHLT